MSLLLFFFNYSTPGLCKLEPKWALQFDRGVGAAAADELSVLVSHLIETYIVRYVENIILV